MARLLFVNAITAAKKAPGVQEIGDLVTIREDGLTTTSTEDDLFDIVDVPGLTVDEVEQILDELRPEVDYDYAEIDSKVKGRWKNPGDGKWYELKKESKYQLSFRNHAQFSQVKSQLKRKNVSKAIKLNLLRQGEDAVRVFSINLDEEIT